MSSSDVILNFIEFLASVRSMFRQTHLYAEKQPALRDVTTSIEPFKAEGSHYSDLGADLSFELTANLRDPPTSERRSIGMSLLVRRSAGTWFAVGEIGWSGDEVGWDSFQSKELEYSSPEDLMANVHTLVEWMDFAFRAAVTELRS
jgi:hypothetical protein